MLKHPRLRLGLVKILENYARSPSTGSKAADEEWFNVFPLDAPRSQRMRSFVTCARLLVQLWHVYPPRMSLRSRLWRVPVEACTPGTGRIR